MIGIVDVAVASVNAIYAENQPLCASEVMRASCGKIRNDRTWSGSCSWTRSIYCASWVTSSIPFFVWETDSCDVISNIF